MIGFIILRHVNSELTNKYWMLSYFYIRKFYPDNPIVIIDDNSNYNFINLKKEKTLKNTKIVKSEFPARGELLPYYYFIKNKFFDKAVIIHDSVFIKKKIDFDVKNYRFIWEFEHCWDNVKGETNLISALKNSEELLKFYNKKNLWKGCFGAMTVISYDFLQEIEKKYEITRLVEFVKNREQRKCLERIFGCIFEYNDNRNTLYGNIQKYIKFGIKFDKKDWYRKKPIIKVWSGR